MAWSMLRPLAICAALAALAGCTPPPAAAPPVVQARTGAYADLWVRDVEAFADMVGVGGLLYGADPAPRTAAQYCNAGNRYLETGEARLAFREKSKALFLATRDGDDVLAAHCAAGVALVYLQVQDWRNAAAWAQQASAILARARPAEQDRRPIFVTTVAHKVAADTAFAAGDLATARARMADALAISGGYPEFRPWLLLGMARIRMAQPTDEARQDAGRLAAEARAAGVPAVQRMADRLLGELALAQGRLDAAEAIFAAPAEDGYQRAWMARGLAQVALRRGQTELAVAQYARAMDAAESVRSWFRAEEFRSGSFGTLADIFAEAIDTLYDAGHGAGRAEAAFDVAERNRARSFSELVRRAEPAQPPRAGMARAVMAALPADTAMLSYATTARATYVWTLRRGSLGWARIELGRAALRGRVAGYVTRVADARTPMAELQRDGAALGTLLLRPAGLRGRERVVVMPHDTLHDLPFAALRAEGEWLADRHRLSYAPSAALWLRPAAARPAALYALLLGNPAFAGRYDQLAGTGQEVAAIAAILPGATQLTGTAATRDAVLAAAPAHNLLHFATHARFDHHDPAYSALLLAGPSAEEGTLDVGRIYGMRLDDAWMVTLSACESGLGYRAGGDEQFGLVNAFHVAGAANVVGTQWSISDDVTKWLMGRFYQEIARGRTPEAALEAAQRMVLADAAFRHPFFWASFKVSSLGDGR